jgi:FMN phosphatase YigB (HAD superfamily)
MRSIDTIVFDIGRVLVHLEFAPLLGFFASHGVDVGHIGELLARIELAAYERGEFDGDELLRRIVALSDGSMPLDTLREHWVGIFVPQQAMLDLARRLAGTRRVFLLSNIGDLHWEHLERELAIGSIGHGALPSYRALVTKPDPAIYRKAEELFNLVPSRTVFIDDLLPNVDTARQRGWHAIHHFSHDATVEDLRKMGVLS